MRFRNGAIFENLKAIGLTAHASRGNATLAGDVIEYADENGSVFANTYDSLGRLTAVAITQATGVVVYSTTTQSFQYDGFSRLVFARDSVPPYPTNADVSIFYDSLGRIVEEDQSYNDDVRYITHDAFTSLPVTDLTYPNGRQINYGYDLLYRRNSVTEVSTSTSIAIWQFFGNRTASVALGNGVTCSMMNNAGTRSAIQAGQPTPPWGDNTTDRLGYDGSGRLIGKRFLSISDTPSTIAFTTSYDPAGNKLYERALHAESRSALYPNYDSINRLLEYDRGVLATGGESITSPIALPGTDSQRTYDLDHLGNWKNTAYMPVGGSATTEVRRHNLVNEITKFATTPVLYDHGNNAASSNPLIAAQGNGNIADDGTRVYGYDALNRLTVVNRKGGDAAQVAAYAYDALGRRVQKISSDGGISTGIVNQTYRYLYDGQQIVEELRYYDGGMIPLRQFIWGQYIDELIQLNVPATTSFPPLTAGTYYPLQDLLYRTTATTNGSGAIVEVYDYDAYGNTLMYNVAGTGGWFADNDTATLQPMCEFLFTGRQYDPETEIYWYRWRYFEPELGRFLSRDVLTNLTDFNSYAYVNANPVATEDPLGLQPAPATQPSTTIDLPGGPFPMNYAQILSGIATARIPGMGVLTVYAENNAVLLGNGAAIYTKFAKSGACPCKSIRYSQDIYITIEGAIEAQRDAVRIEEMKEHGGMDPLSGYVLDNGYNPLPASQPYDSKDPWAGHPRTGIPNKYMPAMPATTWSQTNSIIPVSPSDALAADALSFPGRGTGGRYATGMIATKNFVRTVYCDGSPIANIVMKVSARIQLPWPPGAISGTNSAVHVEILSQTIAGHANMRPQ